MATGWALAAGLAALAALLTILVRAGGLGAAAAGVGLAAYVVPALALAKRPRAGGQTSMGPGDLVTLTRATMACGVAALVAEAFVGEPASPALVGLAAVALGLDAVDGKVARWTHTASAFGARFDGEADAFLMLVLSAYVARSAGAWVLAIGLARYLFWAAGRALPWMRRQLPRRYWRKVVTAVAGVALVVAAAGVAPAAPAVLALLLALGLVAESFSRDVWWLWRHRHAAPASAALPAHAVRLP